MHKLSRYPVKILLAMWYLFERMSYFKVKELIRNSPRLGRTPLRDTTQTVTKVKAIATPGTNAAAVKRVAVPVKGKGRKRSASENWLEHVPSSTVENGKKTK